MTKGTMTTTLDLRGLICPLPVLRANKALRGLGKGEDLRVLATDPAAPGDFRSFCETAGHLMLGIEEADGVFAIVVRKGG